MMMKNGEAGEVNDLQFAFYDLMPTFCDLAGVKNFRKRYTNRQLTDDALTGVKPLPDERYYYLWSYKTWQLSGFTEKKLEWSPIKLYAERPQISLEEAYRQL